MNLKIAEKGGGTMCDSIDRQAAIDIIMSPIEEHKDNFNKGVRCSAKILTTLPSAQSEQEREFIKLTVRDSNGRPYYSIIYLEVDKNGIGHDFEGYSSYSLDVISDYMKKYFMPSAEPEPHWIPCSERLPNVNGIYIVTRRISDGFECRNITDACYFDGSNTWHDDTRVNHERKYLADVLAWMPLPEPYMEEGNE